MFLCLLITDSSFIMFRTYLGPLTPFSSLKLLIWRITGLLFVGFIKKATPRKVWFALLNSLKVLILFKVFFILLDFNDRKKCLGKSASNTACLTDIVEAVDLFYAI